MVGCPRGGRRSARGWVLEGRTLAGPEPRPVGRPEAGERTLGERIHRHRVRAGLSRTQLAGLIGRSSSWLYKVERGVLAPPDRISVLSELARVLRIEVDDLLTDAVSPAAAAAVRRAAVSTTERVPAGRVRSRPAAAPAPAVTPPLEAVSGAAHPAAPSPPSTPVIDRRAVPPVRSRGASAPARRRRWRVGAVVPAMAVTAAAALIALAAALPDDAHHATRTPLREQAAVPHAVLAPPAPPVAPVEVAPAPALEPPPAAPPPSRRPVAAVVGPAAILPRAAGSHPVVSAPPPSSPACSRVTFDGDTGPMRANGGWVYHRTVRPGGSPCASWESPRWRARCSVQGSCRPPAGTGG
jgi:transcriptional regulator with XRE-family HTH domain